MANTYESNKSETLTRLLRRINQGDDPELLRKEANRLLMKLGPRDIATAEQNLIDDGFSAQIVQQLSATFMLMGILEQQCGDPKTSLAPNHILRMVMAEHELLRCFLSALNDVVETIGHLNHLTDVSSEFRKLSHIVQHLHSMKEHIEREEDVIFPYLRKYGWISLCSAMEGDHINIVTELDTLLRSLLSFGKISLDEFKAELITTTVRLSEMVAEHLGQEDNLLYPIALGIINNVQVWDEMKALCDEIGYCGVHL